MTTPMAVPATLPARLDAALKRLASALDQAEAAAVRRADADRGRSNLEDELAVMRDDRSRLAVELDGALARNKSLMLANEEVARRLERAGAGMRALLGDDAPPQAQGAAAGGGASMAPPDEPIQAVREAGGSWLR